MHKLIGVRDLPTQDDLPSLQSTVTAIGFPRCSSCNHNHNMTIVQVSALCSTIKLANWKHIFEIAWYLQVQCTERS